MEQGSLKAFGSVQDALIRLLSHRMLNLEYVAEYMMMPAQLNEGSSEACVYQGIRRTLPGTSVTLTPTMDPERQTFWNWQDHLRDPGTRDTTEIAHGYAEVLRHAVRESSHGKTLAHLSGGMDSTSIAFLAADLSRTGAIASPVHTMTLVYERTPDLDRERPFIEAALERARGIVSHVVLGDDILDYDSFRDPPLLEEPYPGLWRLSMDRVSIDLAARLGMDTVLTGIGADEIHDFLPYHLADLIRSGHLRLAWKEASRWARASNCSPWVLLREYGIASDMPLWAIYRTLSALLPRGRSALSLQDDWTIPPWIVREFAERYDLRARALANSRRRFVSPNAAVTQALRTLCYRAGDALRWTVAAPLGIHYAHPFFDSRVLSLGLGLLSRVTPEPGLMKPVLAEAMQEMLPDCIRNRRSKVGTNALYYAGLSRNLQQLGAMIRKAPAVTSEFFDCAALHQCLQEASLAGAGVRKLQRLNYSLCLIQWLLQQEALRRRTEPTASFRVTVVR